MKAKKTLSLFLAFLMVLGMFPNTVSFAEQAETPVAVSDTAEQPEVTLPPVELEDSQQDAETGGSSGVAEPVAPETAEEPTAPETAEKPATPEAAEEPTAPEAAEQPAAPETAEEPAAPEAAEEPAVPEAAEEPATPEAADEPTLLTEIPADFTLNETIQMKAGSKIKLWERLDGGNADPANVGEYFEGQPVAYDGWQLMKLEITIPNQEGLEVVSVIPQTEGLYPEKSVLSKTDSGYVYTYYFKQNGTYSFDISYTLNGAEGHKTVEYTVSDLIYVPDVTLRAFFIVSIDTNEVHGYVTKTDLKEGRYYSQDGTWQTGFPVNPNGGGPGGFFSYAKNLEGMQYAESMSQLVLYPSRYFHQNPLACESLEPLTRGYYPNVTSFEFTEPYTTSTAVSPNAYTPEMLAQIITTMPNLSTFWANKTGFKDFTAFANLNGKMQAISCKGNEITSLAGLENHHGLSSLSLNLNNITDLTPLADMTEATTWNFIQNNIFDLRPVNKVALSGYGQGMHFGFQTVLPEPVYAELQGDIYRLELPMPIDIDGSSTEIGFASWLAPQIGSQVPVDQRNNLMVQYSDGTRKVYPITTQDGVVYAEIPVADVEGGGTDSAFENMMMRYWFHNDNGKDSRTRGVFNGKVDFSATPVKPAQCNVTITDPDTVYQGDNTKLTFGFNFSKGIGETYAEGETIVLPSNIGELFQAEWDKDFKNLPIKDENQNVIATVDIKAEEIVITISADGAGNNSIAGELSTESKLMAKNVGATKDNDVVKALNIGCGSKDVSFKYKEHIPPAGDDPVDIDTFWKNGSSAALNQTGAVIMLEVNPIGSMDLYGSTTYKDADGNYTRKPLSHKNMLVEDPIPDSGFIDPDSVQIYAAVPTIGRKDTDMEGWYKVPAGVNYAVRKGTLRWILNDYNGNQNVRITQLEQNTGETLEQFRDRINENQLQWGIYRDEATKAETFFCNFGNVGKFDDGTQNNGILYKDYPDRNYGILYPEIFGENGASGGNIVSYYIEFNTYYPDVVGEKQVKNTAYFSSNSTDAQGREAVYTINNGDGTGVVRNDELKIKLVDKADMKTPIADAEFKVQQWENGQWKDTTLAGKTDANGNLTFGPFPVGKYKLVQTSTAQGYKFDNTGYGPSPSSDTMLNSVSSNGEFELAIDNKHGFGTVVTNEKLTEYQVNFEFVSQDTDLELPAEVTNQLPAVQTVTEGEAAKVPADLVFEEVKTADGVWSFVSWDKTEVENVAADVLFTGAWEFSKSSPALNTAPVIVAKDREITVGDKFSPLEGVTATDEQDGNITDKVEVISNEVDSTRAGKYEVTYKVTDKGGASTVKTITVTVKEKPVTPDKPNDPSKTPQTGDSSNLILWALLCVSSLVGAGYVVYTARKKSKN